jgi:DNA-binding NarL/FixJ family response regulator
MPSNGYQNVRVLICEDHRLVADAFALAVRATHDLDLVGDPVASAEAAIEIADRERPDVSLVDVYLEGATNGIEATRQIRAVSPQTRVVVLSGDRRDERLVDAFEAGASAFLYKGEPLGRLIDAIRDVGRGRTLIDDDSMPALLERTRSARARRSDVDRRFARLTPREREVLMALRSGTSNDAIAQTLRISRRTVDTHVQNILRKLGVHTKLQAVALIAAREHVAS